MDSGQPPPASGRTKPAHKDLTADQTSPKRQKTTSSESTAIATPLVSALSGAPYLFDKKEQETRCSLKFSPLDDTIDLPDSAPLFLNSLVRPFAHKVHDILIGPSYLIANFTMNANEMAQYYKIVRARKIRVPNSDFFFKIETVYMEELLDDLLGTNLANEASDESDDFMESASSDSDSERNPIPPWERKSLPDSSHAEPEEASSRRSASPTPTTAEPRVAEPAAPATKPKPKGRARFTKVDFSQLTVEVPAPADFLTIIFRAPAAEHSLKFVNPLRLCDELHTKGGFPQATRDIRDGGLAIDFPPDTPPGPLLAITELQKFPVTASLPLQKSNCDGVITGVHWELTEQEIMDELKTTETIKLLAAKRLARPGERSWVVKLSFKGLMLPDRALLAGRSHRVKPYIDRPLQCKKCARYGHPARLCRSSERCWTCGQPHPASDCPNQAAPLCALCRGAHPANSPTCPTRSFEAKILQVKASTNSTHKAARSAVTAAARSYASALKGPTPTARPPRPPRTPLPTLPQQPPGNPGFKPNIAHPRPNTPPIPTSSLAELFRGLVSLLTAAIASNDFQGALAKMGDLFTAQAPGADPDLFRVLP